ncbi:NAD(P)/FAD-dependent oxidoreductase [Pseudonocardia sp. HH130630-07]|uniref:NAD(P)/FAD-dependent oxidoreductase n=1 Tax=Pseudonocardia sp. HH130630-07 TaxID=1690815 RepID=UPI000814F966|nr:FAD-dependent oxidoreductase [Pseudonocardia sp. HH130630-07]ANY05787.1 hypothetical protein AFB00_05140 [Pseudonocardia sp. HH130630-07]
MTAAYDIVIVGNGILGIASALELVRADPALRVAVVGPSDRTGGASAAAGAMLSCFGEVTHRTLASEPGRVKLELSLQALEEWPAWLDGLNDELPDERELAIREGSYVLLNSYGGRLDSLNYRAIVDAVCGYGRKFEILPLGEVPNLDPAVNARPLEAVHLPEEGSIDARAVLDRATEVARRNGVTIHDDSVVGWQQQRGRGQGVLLRSGEALSAGSFLVAAGAFTPAIVQDLKDPAAPLMPILSGVGVAVTCQATSSGLRHVVRTPNRSGGCGLHLVPGGDTVYIGATNDVLLNPGAWSSLGMAHFLASGAMEQFDRRLFGSSVTAWHAGNRPLPLDGYPVVGQLWQDNVWVLSGTYRDGFHCAPVLARHAADLVRGGSGVLGHELFAPLRPPLRTLSQEQAVDEIVLHCVSQFYQYSPRLAPWMRITEGMEGQVRKRTEATYHELDSEVGLAPELLELLNWGRGRKQAITAFRRYLASAM